VWWMRRLRQHLGRVSGMHALQMTAVCYKEKAAICGAEVPSRTAREHRSPAMELENACRESLPSQPSLALGFDSSSLLMKVRLT
jgi:hypothetical protein